MFQVFISTHFDYFFPDAGEPLDSPLVRDGKTFYRLDATFFAWASQVIPRAIAANALSPDEADTVTHRLEDMRHHLARTDPSAMAEAERLSRAPVRLPK